MKKYNTELKWGLIFFGVSILWMIFEKLMGWHDENIEQQATYTNFFAILAISMYVFALLEKRKKFYGGFMTWKQGFISGLFITLTVAILSPAGQLITHLLISPDYFENVIALAVEKGEMTQDEAALHFNLNNYIMISFMFALLVGFVTSALVALFVMKKQQNVTS